MDLGFVFCFLSHQWLGWGEADPHGKHMDAMRRAVQAVARDAGVPLASVRVWCDVVSIPQKNRSEQRLAIASLPTFASCSNYFVAVRAQGPNQTAPLIVSAPFSATRGRVIGLGTGRAGRDAR